MNAVVRLWFLLTAFYAVFHGTLFILVWRTVDLRLEVVAQYAAIPLLQAMGLAWVAGDLQLKECARAVRQIVSRPVVVLLWCAEGALLCLYWVLQPEMDFTEMVARTAGVEALVAAGILIIRVLPGAGLRIWTAILPFSMVILLLASNGVRPWFNVLPLWLPHGWPLLLRQMAVLGGTVVTLLVLTGKAEGALSERSPVAGIILGWAQLFFVAAAYALAINGYLFDFLISPWREIITTFLSLAATSLLTASLCLLPWQVPNRKDTPSTNRQIPIRSPGFLGVWAVLAICAAAATLILRIIFFPCWDWNLQALLPLAFIPLIQTSWLRWVYALHTHFRSVFRLVRARPFLCALLLTEVIFFFAIALPRGLWEDQAVGTAVAIWVGLKLVILGPGSLKATQGEGVHKIFRGICAAGALICGIAVACTSGLQMAPWMMAVLGSICILLTVWRYAHPENTVRLAGAAAEACLMPVVVMALCTLLTWVYPMDPLPWVAYSLMAFSTTFMAVGLRENASKDN